MKIDERKTKAQLIEELDNLRKERRELTKEVNHYEELASLKTFADEIFKFKQDLIRSGFTEEQAQDLLCHFSVRDVCHNYRRMIHREYSFI